jgi:hypothetical protein
MKANKANRKIVNSNEVITPWGSYRPDCPEGLYTVTITIGNAFYLCHARACRNHGEALLKALINLAPDEPGIADIRIVGLCTYEGCWCERTVHAISMSIPVAGCWIGPEKLVGA